MILILHLIDASFSPVHSYQTAIEPISQEPNEHIVKLPVGHGSQTIKWLTLAAQQRLQQLHKHHGRVRHREPVLGSGASFIPTGVGLGEVPEKDALDPYMQLSDVFQDKDHVYIVFNQQLGASITDWGSSAFYRGRYVEQSENDETTEKAESENAPKLKPKDPSMFFERMFEADSRSHVETRAIMDRAFETDWKFHVKKPRFMNRQPRTVREKMREYYPCIKALYTYYSAMSSDGSPFTMNMNELRILMERCDLPMDHIDVIWNETNFDRAHEKGNSAHALARFEFVEILIRLAWEHYVPEEAKKEVLDGHDKLGDNEAMKKGDISSKKASEALALALEEMIEEHIFPQAWRGIPHARFFADPDAFRRERLYNEQINKVLLKHCDDLYSLFVAYCQHTQAREGRVVGGEQTPVLLGWNEFLEMCKASSLIGSPTESKQGGTSRNKTKGSGNTQKDDTKARGNTHGIVRIAFALSQMTVVDELRRSKRRAANDSHQKATFVEFLEAITRLADMRADPKGNDPKYQLSEALHEVLTMIVKAHENNNFWKNQYENVRRRWRDYKKKFGDSLNAVKRSGYGPEVGKKETRNSSKQVLVRRKLSTEGVFAMKESTMSVLSRKYNGGVLTKLASEAKAAAEAEGKAAEGASDNSGDEQKSGKSSKSKKRHARK